MKIYIYLIPLFFTISCNNDLPNPITIKGMKLGLSFDEQVEIGKQNGLCQDLNPDEIRYYYNDKNTPLTDKCIYKINDAFYAIPINLKSTSYNGNKILSSVEILFYSTQIPSDISNFFGDRFKKIGLVKFKQVYQIKKMFDQKYGKNQSIFNSDTENGLEYGICKWNVDDLTVKLEFVQKAGFIGFYLCWATYEYNEKIKEELEVKNENF